MTQYTTVQGDTWDLIAHKTLGDASYVNLLIEANPAFIHTLFFSAGAVLNLPEIPADTSLYIPPWKR